jgi:hypothetical protein
LLLLKRPVRVCLPSDFLLQLSLVLVDVDVGEELVVLGDLDL